jgi:Protein of unknown function (DUF3047)
MISSVRSQLDHVLAGTVSEALLPQIADARLMHLPGTTPPWQGTGIRLRRGQSYTLFASGRIQWSAQYPARYGGPRFHLWARVAPGGAIVNLTQDTGTFAADVDGELELGIYMGVWKNRAGELATPVKLYQALDGHLECWAVAWRGSAVEGLAALAQSAPIATCVSNEQARLDRTAQTPAGWSYLLETGTAEIFSAVETPHACIQLDADDDQGIITRDVDFPLTPHTRLSWRWRADLLPSTLAEDTVHTHDYFSIATEFDNGRDLTWIWSSCLPPGTHFHCPIRAWTPRETHFVVRTGIADLGHWRDETREVFADVAAAMGKPPTRIVRIWLIAVSSFQHQRARAMFSDIVLQDDGQTVRIF